MVKSDRGPKGKGEDKMELRIQGYEHSTVNVEQSQCK